MQQLILGSFAGEWFRVQTEAQARLLTDPASRAYLAPFIGFERSASQAAREVGCSLQRLQYRMGQFILAGLLHETRRQPRAGRAVRYYRAVADGFEIPFALTPFEDIAALIKRHYAPSDRLRNRVTARRVRERDRADRRVYRDSVSGELYSESAVPEGLPADTAPASSNDVVFTVRLTAGQIQALSQTLTALYQDLRQAQPAQGGQPCLVHFGLLPLAPEDLD